MVVALVGTESAEDLSELCVISTSQRDQTSGFTDPISRWISQATLPTVEGRETRLIKLNQLNE